MTRETKIGLLVGLTFIIIVGILLSPSMSSSYDSQPAQLPAVGNNVRAGVTTPGAAQPPISFVDNTTVAPQQTVPTQREVASRTPNGGGGAIIVGPGTDHAGSTGRIEVDISGQNPAPKPSLQDPNYSPQARREVYRTGTGDASVTLDNGSRASGSIDIGNPTLSNAGRIPSDLAREASRHGESLVPADDRSPAGGTSHTTPGPNGSQKYVAQSGDSLSKIAARFYGSSTRARCDAIVQANPSLASDPNKIISGRTYVIPAPLGASNSGPSSSNAQELQPPIRAEAPTPTQVASAGSMYTVKENDNLWRIARDQCGDPAAISAIKELNKDVLGGSDQVRVNMKLRLPGKTVN